MQDSIEIVAEATCGCFTKRNIQITTNLPCAFQTSTISHRAYGPKVAGMAGVRHWRKILKNMSCDIFLDASFRLSGPIPILSVGLFR
ncbi:hypothetical protein M378DRAFT_169846 [Amanita muscaria Koide BX008]|uniref:Uncharacterized protein n=1 Tax=Amanita muscaria (strain Koide BX008) TaxID=946122 RepID=A0A0C2WQT2_AMAMK|nr:hypothetical protein M378DRAFT_169846 [Amanita muscaria Koide BX008]